jgi:hypothetical protein
MIDSVEPLSCVLWAFAFFAAGMYPLGFMMGAPCSPCCGVDCLPLFYRCRRQVSLNGSVPPTPSETIYTLEDAYIYTASNESTLKVSLNDGGTHWRLRGNQFVTYETELTHYATGGVLVSQQAPCQAVKPKVRVKVQGVTAPIEFADTVLTAVASGGDVSRTANIVAGENLGGGNQYNTGATITTTVVAASVSGSTSKVDGSIVTEAFLRGLLTATTSAPASSSTTCVVTLSGNLAAFGYMNAAESCVLSWLVRVVRDSVPHEFVVTVTVNGRSNFTPLPEGGLTAVSVPSLPTPARGIREAYVPPVVVRTDADYAITVKPRRNASGVRVATAENLSLVFSLAGRCRLGLWQRRFFGNLGSASQTILAGWSTPTVLAESTGTAGSFAFGNRANNDPETGAHLPDYSSDTIAFLPPWDTAIVAGTYGVEQIEGYRDDGDALPATSGTGLFEVSLVEPSPMCGMPVCSLPRSLLPNSVTYTPAAGVMWGCRQAPALVLGNSASSVCTYSHTTNKCLSSGSASVSLFNLFTAWNTTPEIKAAKLDALTWLDYDVDTASFVSGGNTFVFGGTYDPTFERPGGCYATSILLPGVPDASGLPAQAANVGGLCFPSEMTVTVPSFPINPPPHPSIDWEPSLSRLRDSQADFVAKARLGNFSYQPACDRMSYAYIDAETITGTLVTDFSRRFRSIQWFLTQACNGSIHQRGEAVVEYQHSTPTSPSTGIRVLLSFQFVTGFFFDNGIIRETPGSGSHFLIVGRVDQQVGNPFVAPYYQEIIDAELAAADGAALPQCSGVGFTPTTITVPLTRQPSFTYGRPDRVNDVVATGPWMPCGYNRRLWDWRRGDSQAGTGSQPAGLPASQTVTLPENDDSEPVTHTVTLTSDGSDPTDITVTVPGRCGTIATDTAAFSLVSGNTRRQNPLEPMRCVTIPVITGRTCAWTAVASGNIAIEEGTETGTGTGSVKAIRDAEGRLSGTITITLDNPIPSDSWRYSYSPLIIEIG